MLQRRPLMLPTLAVAFVIAVGFFRLYGTFVRPDVPRQVSATIDHFARGLAIGSTASESAKGLQEMHWVQHVGFVGPLAGTAPFAEARLFPRLGERRKLVGDAEGRVDAIELVSADGGSIAKVMSDLGIVFRGSPKDGCIVPRSADAPYRRVQYWTTRGDDGGAAVLTDWTFPDTGDSEVAVWSMLLWAGPFRGSETLVAAFDPRTCLEIVGT